MTENNSDNFVDNSTNTHNNNSDNNLNNILNSFNSENGDMNIADSSTVFLSSTCTSDTLLAKLAQDVTNERESNGDG